MGLRLAKILDISCLCDKVFNFIYFDIFWVMLGTQAAVPLAVPVPGTVTPKNGVLVLHRLSQVRILPQAAADETKKAIL